MSGIPRILKFTLVSDGRTAVVSPWRRSDETVVLYFDSHEDGERQALNCEVILDNEMQACFLKATTERKEVVVQPPEGIVINETFPAPGCKFYFADPDYTGQPALIGTIVTAL